MRKLFVKRKWSIVECVTRVFFYVECGKKKSAQQIGDRYYEKYRLRNGKTLEIEIPNDERYVRVMTNTTQSYYIIAAGENDVYLTVKPEYCPAKKNPFVIYE